MWLRRHRPPADIYMGRKQRATATVAEVLEIACVPDSLGARFNALWTARGLILAPQLPTLVDLLLLPSFNGLSAVPHMAAHPVAEGGRRPCTASDTRCERGCPTFPRHP